MTLFLAVTFVFTWSLLPFAASSIPVSLVALCGPAVGAVAAVAWGTREDRADLVDRMLRWRVPARWYAFALLLPLPITAARSGIELSLGASGPVRPQSVSALGLIVFVLVAGEEVGWRGFALPRLLTRFGPWASSAILGVVWALWHLPLFYMTGMPQHGSPFVAFVVYTIALSVILTLLHERARQSVVIATVFHGAVNTLGFVTPAEPALRGWTNALVYGVAAVAMGALTWLPWRPRGTRADGSIV